jgi:hypothetical protein
LRSSLARFAAAAAAALGVTVGPHLAETALEADAVSSRNDAAFVVPGASRAHAELNKGFINFGMGPQFFLQGGGTQFFIQFQGGLEFQEQLYLTFVPTFGFGQGTALITLPIGIQYDIPIRTVPNLYVYPRFGMGVGIFTAPGQAAFNITPEFGIKYVIDGKFNIGFEPFSIPIYVADSPGLPTTQYRMTFLGGLTF